jgi:hypothetical protein
MRVFLVIPLTQAFSPASFFLPVIRCDVRGCTSLVPCAGRLRSAFLMLQAEEVVHAVHASTTSRSRGENSRSPSRKMSRRDLMLSFAIAGSIVADSPVYALAPDEIPISGKKLKSYISFCKSGLCTETLS